MGHGPGNAHLVVLRADGQGRARRGRLPRQRALVVLVAGATTASWVFLGGFVPPETEGKPPEMRTFLLPRSDYRIDDNWHVAGLKGTGSKDIVVENAFVPEHRTHKLIDGFKRQSPGNAVNPAPLYRLPFGQIFVRSVSTSAIGAAQGALDCVPRHRREARRGERRRQGGRGSRRRRRSARALRRSSTRRGSSSHRNFERDDGASSAPAQDIPIDRRVRFRHDSAMAVVKSVEAVDLLFTASGGRAIFLDSPLLRFFLDVHAARAHYANNPDKPGRNFGGVLLGAKTVDYFI